MRSLIISGIVALVLILFGIVATFAQDAAETIDGAWGITCKTPGGVIDFNQATALLTDEEWERAVEHIDDVTGGECWWGQIRGIILDSSRTFLRRDNRVIEIVRYAPSMMLGVKLYTFRAKPMAEDGGA